MLDGGSTTSPLAFQPSSSTLSIVQAAKYPPTYPPGAGAPPTAQSGTRDSHVSHDAFHLSQQQRQQLLEVRTSQCVLYRLTSVCSWTERWHQSWHPDRCFREGECDGRRLQGAFRRIYVTVAPGSTQHGAFVNLPLFIRTRHN